LFLCPIQQNRRIVAVHRPPDEKLQQRLAVGDDESAHAQIPADTLGVIVSGLGAPLAVGGQRGGLRLHLGAHEVHDRLRHLLRGDRCGVQEAYQQEGEGETELVFITSASPRFPQVNRGENEVPAKQLRGPLAAQRPQASPLVDSGVLGDERQL